MVAPLLNSKYRRPRPRTGVVARPRLADRLSAIAGHPLTLVSAPAGFGKTTLVAEWLAVSAGDTAVAWLSLDARDNEPAVFWTYVITALQTAVPGVGATALPLVAATLPSTEAIATLLNDLDELRTDLVLVLDDYHLIENTAVHEALAFLLEHQPPHLHIVLTTRVDPPLALPRLRARGQLLEVRAADLRFTAAETAAYLNGPMELGLSDTDVAALEARTEGWIAALQLAALSLHGRADASAFIAGFAGDDRYIVDYLAEEVLARQPVDVREFLLQTSILERLTGSLCDAVSARPDGKATLMALERANLFLVPLDDRREWYRYHHLFADVLQAHLVDERPDELSLLHQRASAWFHANDDSSSAIRHALAGGDTDRAADLMELAVPRVGQERREAEFARWLHTLPADVLRRRPVLGVAFVGALAQVSDFTTVAERLDQIESLVREADGRWSAEPPPGVTVVDRDGYRSLPARVEMYRAALALTQADLAGTIEHAREALSLAQPEDALARAAAGALAGLASWTTGDLAGAHAAYTESVAGLTTAGHLADVLGCTITLGDIRRTQGQLGAALHTYQQALALAAAAPGTEPLRGTADMHVGIAGVLLERNDLAAAADHLARSERLGEQNGLPQNPYRYRVVLARLRAADGDLDDALTLTDEADHRYAGDYSPNVAPVPALRARLWVRRGELALAQDWARERKLAADDDVTYLREYEQLTLARLLIARCRVEPDARHRDDILTLLARLLVAAEGGGRGASVIEVLVLQALAHHMGRDAAAARAALHRAVMLAEPEGYVRLFLDEGAPLAALLQQLRGQPDAPAYVNRLVAAGATAGRPTPAHQKLVDALSERELDVLRLLGGDLGGPDIARQLSISLNTVRTHTKNVYAKLGVTSRRTAVRRARELDLIPGGQRIS